MARFVLSSIVAAATLVGVDAVGLFHKHHKHVKHNHAVGGAKQNKDDSNPTMPGDYEDEMPVTSKNEYKNARVRFHNLRDCSDPTTQTFDSSANVFIPAWQKYYNNARSVSMCGRGELYLYGDAGMDLKLAHIKRCDKKIESSKNLCHCQQINKSDATKVQSFTLNYC